MFQCTTANPPTSGTSAATGTEGARRVLRLKGYSDRVTETILHSRRPSTWKQYGPHVSRWDEFCIEHDLDNVHTNVKTVLIFLQSLKDSGFSYSSINSAKAALTSSVVLPEGKQLGTDNDIHHFMRGLYNENPPKPRYSKIWDADNVIKWMAARESLQASHTDILVKKLATLILLVTGQRPSIHAALKISHMSVD